MITENNDILRRSLLKTSAIGEGLLSFTSAFLPLIDDVVMLVTLMLNDEGVSIVLRVGEERLYVVRHIPHFIQDIKLQKIIPFGKGFSFDPRTMHFNENQSEILSVLEEYCDAADNFTQLTGAKARMMHLKPKTALRILQLLETMPFHVTIDETTTKHKGIRKDALPIVCQVSGNLHTVKVVLRMPSPLYPFTKDYTYVYVQGRIFKTNKIQRELLKTIASSVEKGVAQFYYTGDDVERFITEVLPVLSSAVSVHIEESLEKCLNKENLEAEIYLDKTGRSVTARVKFRYGKEEIDPFSPRQGATTLLLRDTQKESAIMTILSTAGFHVTKGTIYLTDSALIYRFVTEGIIELNKMTNVFLSKDFKKFTPKKPSLNGSFVRKNNGIELTMMDGDLPLEELLPIMRALSEKRMYFQFKDGTFLDLSEETKWQDMATAYVEAASGKIDMRDLATCRASYFQQLIQQAKLPVTLDKGTKQVADMRYTAPVSSFTCLRPYQQKGYAWLMTLQALGMGGILADDMGLGKTIQTIAALSQCIENEKEQLPSLIIAPTSLLYNWQSEIQKFAPHLNVLMIRGSQVQRAEQIEQIPWLKPDIVITSYPLVRRDKDFLEKILFRYLVLDEAQLIKNMQSVGAQVVKKLQAKARIALTGTPMENHAGELWSIFDFCLPGYLPPYAVFLKRYGEGENIEDLKNRIRPFLLRRLKADVLTELPERLEKTLFTELSSSQQRVYDAVLMQTKDRIDKIITDKGMQKGRAEVLAAITQLRQVCCNPSLCMDGYIGSSGKEELLKDILPGIISNGGRILLFSQFTSMLKLLEKWIVEMGIETLYLDGHTPPSKRQEMTTSFNNGYGQVFLISLKAGGTGLNLTGADTVIHFDPWWNPTAQEQATGRAHRIGQKKKITVLSLVTHGTIEEQVVKMSEKKRQLFDKLITAGETLPTSLSDKDILSLFGR